MEVSRRRMIHKHLQPTRPLRRCSYVDCDLQITAAACGQAHLIQETKVDLEQLYSNVSLQEPKKARISYSREFLMRLASSPEARIKPPFLPENPIVLSQAILGNSGLVKCKDVVMKCTYQDDLKYINGVADKLAKITKTKTLVAGLG